MLHPPSMPPSHFSKRLLFRRFSQTSPVVWKACVRYQHHAHCYIHSPYHKLHHIPYTTPPTPYTILPIVMMSKHFCPLKVNLPTMYEHPFWNMCTWYRGRGSGGYGRRSIYDHTHLTQYTHSHATSHTHVHTYS
ncbi:hypothetical protein EON63_13250 [archaeon]|nr:MAG: hypothetical protein EON63_13250 [archaeon]